MNQLRVLVIEDEPRVAQMIKIGLEENGYIVENAFDGEEGCKKAIESQWHAIILDINLPLMNGFDVCKKIRVKDGKTPILMLTAMGDTTDKLTGFNSGADDYIVKPFEFKELIARLKVFIKRTSNENSSNILLFADMELNLDLREVTRSGKRIDLTAKEFALMEYFIRNKGRVITRNELAEKIWHVSFDTGTNVIDVYINYLRRKIDKDFEKKLIYTVIGMGYTVKE